MQIGSWMLAFVCVVAAAPAAAAVAEPSAALECDPAADHDTAIMPLQHAAVACGRDEACQQAVEAKWKAAFEARPRDVRAHHAYQRAWSRIDPARLERVYKEKMEANPRDPLFVTLYGHSLPKERVGDKIAAYEKALGLQTDYAWAHYNLAAVLTGREGKERRDPARARRHVQAWLAACPADVHGLQFAASLDDPAFAAERAAAARRAVEKGDGEWAARRYEALWALEFKAAPPSAHEDVRRRIRADVARIEALEPGDRVSLWSALVKGHELIGDGTKRDAAEKEMARRLPCEPPVISRQLQAWSDAHPTPDLFAEPAARLEHRAARYAFETSLAKACPESATVAAARVRSARDLPDLPTAEAEAVFDAYVAARAHGASTGSLFGDPAVELCINRRIRLEAAQELLRRSLEMEITAPPADAPSSRRNAHLSMVWRTKADRLWLQARLDNLAGRAAERDAALKTLEQMLGEAPRAAAWRGEAQVAWLRAEIAEQEGRKADAAVYYQQAYPGFRHDEPMVAANREALRRLGASEGALAALKPPRHVRATGLDRWQTIERALPPASLGRLGGGTWTMADFKGRRTLVNVWATWCAPCKKELPEVEKLHRRLKGRSDIAIVTFNVDEHAGLVAPFVKEHGYTFPVVLADAYWDALGVEGGIPTNWIVNGKGVAVAELQGFGSDEGWVETSLARLEGRTAKATAEP